MIVFDHLRSGFVVALCVGGCLNTAHMSDNCDKDYRGYVAGCEIDKPVDSSPSGAGPSELGTTCFYSNQDDIISFARNPIGLTELKVTGLYALSIAYDVGISRWTEIEEMKLTLPERGCLFASARNLTTLRCPFPTGATVIFTDKNFITHVPEGVVRDGDVHLAYVEESFDDASPTKYLELSGSFLVDGKDTSIRIRAPYERCTKILAN
jgi:hypothetical protein